MRAPWHTFGGLARRCSDCGSESTPFFIIYSILTSKEIPLLCNPIAELLRPERQLALHLFTTTKLTIARAWKTPVLSFEVVKNYMDNIMVTEKLTAILSDTHDKFLQVWQPWVDYTKPTRFDITLLWI